MSEANPGIETSLDEPRLVGGTLGAASLVLGVKIHAFDLAVFLRVPDKERA